MKVLVLSLAMMITGLISAEASAQVIPTETGDYCKDQALNQLRALYGVEVEIEAVFVDGAHETVNYWMRTNLCDGHLVASFVRNASCKVAHYGSVPQYMKRLWAHGENCQKVLQEDLFS